MTNRVLTTLGRLNRTTVFLATMVLVFVSLVVGGWFGGLVLLALAAGLLMLLTRVWDASDVKGRAARLAVLTLLMVMAIVQFRR
jgi:hypothetical protein